MRSALLLCAAAIAMAVAVAAAARGSGETTLEARAVLPALTFAAGPPSGSLIGTTPINGVTPPFSGQPVQAISAVLDGPGDTFWAMPDNGKRIFVVDLTEVGADGFLVKARGAEPARDPGPGRDLAPRTAGRLRVGGPVQVPVPDDRERAPAGRLAALIANDNNFPFSAGRNPGLPDDNELIIVRVPSLR